MSGALSSIASAASEVAGAAAFASGALDAFFGAFEPSWLDFLVDASFRGVPFVTRECSLRHGRRTSVHEYPNADSVWVEDLGLAVRRFSFVGFVLGDDCFDQAAALTAACDMQGPGELVHPVLGPIQVSLVDVEQGIRADAGRVVAFSFVFIQGSPPTYPQSAIDPATAIDDDADSADDAASSDFVADIGSAVTNGLNVAASAASVCLAWVSLGASLVGDASMLFRCVAGVAAPFGQQFSRYHTGALGGPQSSTLTVSDAISAAVAGQAAVQAASSALVAAAANAGTSQASLIASAATAYAEAVRALAVDPADGVRLLSTLAAYQTPAIDGASVATAACVRRAALTSLARACESLQPASSQQASAVLALVVTALDAEIMAAADAFDAATWAALRQLRNSVSAALSGQVQSLPSLVTIRSGGSLPALVWAQTLYQDGTRGDQLVAIVNPINPNFMPATFQAPAS